MGSTVKFKRNAGFGSLQPDQIESFEEISHAKVKGNYESRSVAVHITDDGTLNCSACQSDECQHERIARDNLPWSLTR